MKRLSTNLLSILASDLARRVLGFLAVTYMARVIGVEGFGLLNFALTVLSYLLMISSAGTHNYGTREVAQSSDEHLVGAIVSARLANAVVVFAALWIVVLLRVRGADERWVILLVSASVIPQAFSLDWYYQGKERMGIIGAAKTLSAAVFLVVLVLVVRKPSDIIFAGVASLAADISTVVLVFARFRREVSEVKLSLGWMAWRSLTERSLPMGLGSILAHLSINFPVLYLGVAGSNTQVGLYSAASKLVFFLLVIDRVLGQLLLPASSRLHAESRGSLKSTLERTLKWILVLGLPITVGGLLLAEPLLVIVYGSSFQPAATVFRLLLWYFFFTLLHTVYTTGLLAIGGETHYRNVMFLSAGAFGCTTVLGVQWWGIEGAALAVCLSEAVTLLLMRRALMRTVSLHRPSGFGVIVLATACMGVTVFALSEWMIVYRIAAGTALYVAMVFLFNGVRKEELLYLRSKLV